jgi:hypothetical protein
MGGTFITCVTATGRTSEQAAITGSIGVKQGRYALWQLIVGVSDIDFKLEIL